MFTATPQYKRSFPGQAQNKHGKIKSPAEIAAPAKCAANWSSTRRSCPSGRSPSASAHCSLKLIPRTHAPRTGCAEPTWLSTIGRGLGRGAMGGQGGLRGACTSTSSTFTLEHWLAQFTPPSPPPIQGGQAVVPLIHKGASPGNGKATMLCASSIRIAGT